MSIYFDTNFCCDVHDIMPLTAIFLEGGEDSDMKLAVCLSLSSDCSLFVQKIIFLFWTYAKELSIPVTLSPVTFSLNINEIHHVF